jgi:PilZ domain
MYDHRKAPRWRINKRILFNIKKDAYCQLKDINCNGAQITLPAKLPQEKVFKMRLRLSEEHAIEAKAWTAWHKVIDGTNHYGLYFNQIKDADKDKINKFICSAYPNDDPGGELKLGLVDAEEGKGGEKMDDHRIFERFRKEFSARFVGLDGKEGVAQTFDVSAKGLGLSTNQGLESQSNLEIWLDVPNSTDPLYTRGQVVWSKLDGKDGYHTGIELERADLMGISRLLRA